MSETVRVQTLLQAFPWSITSMVQVTSLLSLTESGALINQGKVCDKFAHQIQSRHRLQQCLHANSLSSTVAFPAEAGQVKCVTRSSTSMQ